MTINTRLNKLERQRRVAGDIINITVYRDESKEDAVARYKAERGLTDEQYDRMTEHSLVVLITKFSHPRNGANGLTLVPEGEYDLAFLEWETKAIFRNYKLYLHFRIVTQGPHFGRELPAYFTITPKGKCGKRGRFLARPKSKFARTFALLFHWAGRGDRFPMTRFENVIVTGRVVTVKKGSDQRGIPEICRYSKVDGGGVYVRFKTVLS